MTLDEAKMYLGELREFTVTDDSPRATALDIALWLIEREAIRKALQEDGCSAAYERNHMQWWEQQNPFLGSR